MGGTWLITLVWGVGANLTVDIRNFNLRTSRFRKMGKISLN